MIDTFRIGAVILAGGRGSRMHSAIQKQYMLLNGRPLISYALEAFEQSCADELVLVDSNEKKVESECQDLRDSVAYLPHRVTVNIGTYEDLGDCDVEQHRED